MADTTTTELVMILDKSGSMNSLAEDAIGGFNATMQDQKDKGGAVLVSTVLFSDDHQIIHDRIPISDVPEMTREQYRTGGCTALLDCLGSTIEHIEHIHKYARKEDIPEHTLFIITTDGLENASRRYSSEEVKKKIEQKKKDGWEFLYLAANIDAVETAGNIGIDKDRTASFFSDSGGWQSVFGSVGSAIHASYGCSGKGYLDCTAWRDDIDRDNEKRKKAAEVAEKLFSKKGDDHEQPV